MNSPFRIILLAIIALFSSLSTQAQHLEIDAGYTGTFLQQKQGGAHDATLLSGAHAGVQCDFDVFKRMPNLSLTAGLLGEMRAGRYDIGWYKEGTTSTRTLYYALVPVRLTYRLPINQYSNWVFFAGPEMSIGLFGETNEHYYLATHPQIDDSKPFSDAMNRFDCSFGLGAGYQYAHMIFKLSYDFPLTNSSANDDPSTLKQHNIRFSIAYSFRKLTR
jgi:hypothetical protein